MHRCIGQQSVSAFKLIYFIIGFITAIAVSEELMHCSIFGDVHIRYSAGYDIGLCVSAQATV